MSHTKERMSEANLDFSTTQHLLAPEKPASPNREISLLSWKKITTKYGPAIPEDACKATEMKINSIFDIYENGLPEGEPKREMAFFIHPRDSVIHGDYQDIKSQFPALSSEYMPLDEILSLYETFPPFEATTYDIETADRGTVKGSLICAPLTVDSLYKNGGGKQDIEHARKVIVDTASFAKKIGVKIIGLGETMAAVTKYGQKVEEAVPEIKVTTGHGGTCYLIERTVESAAEQTGAILSEEELGIIGCGSIGTATALEMADKVGGFILYDKIPGAAESLSRKIKEANPEAKITVVPTYQDVCQSSKFIVGAASAPEPFIKEGIQKGTVFVDDSQPPAITRETAEANESIVLWPIGDMSPRMDRGDNYNFGKMGLVPGPEGKRVWGCELEALSLLWNDALPDRVTTAVTSEKTKAIGVLAEKAGFKVCDHPFQSFGRSIDSKQLEIIKNHRFQVPTAA